MINIDQAFLIIAVIICSALLFSLLTVSYYDIIFFFYKTIAFFKKEMLIFLEDIDGELTLAVTLTKYNDKKTSCKIYADRSHTICKSENIELGFNGTLTHKSPDWVKAWKIAEGKTFNRWFSQKVARSYRR